MQTDKSHFILLKILIHNAKSKCDNERLELVNQFFNNRIRYSSDYETWGVGEYWASLDETLEKKAGDCEDYAIAKYFTLKAIGVDEEKLKLIQVRVLTTKVSHMVLAYCDSDVLILDNLIDDILPLSDRSDIVPIMGFNRFGLWIFRKTKPQILTQDSKRLSRWRDLQKKAESFEFRID